MMKCYRCSIAPSKNSFYRASPLEVRQAYFETYFSLLTFKL
jgi:hypothetical protein